MTTDEQTAMQMGAYALERAIERLRVELKKGRSMNDWETESSVNSERTALAMMNEVLEKEK